MKQKIAFNFAALFVLGLSAFPLFGADVITDAAGLQELTKKSIVKVDTIATEEEGGSRYNLQELTSLDLGIPPYGANLLGYEIAVNVLGYYLDENGDPDGVFGNLGRFYLVHNSELEADGEITFPANYTFDSTRSSADAFWVLKSRNIGGIPVADGLRESEIEIIAGTIKQRTGDKTKWDLIADSEHTPVGVGDIVPTATGATIRVNFDKSYSRVISFICGPDEHFAQKFGMSLGASVGLGFVDIKAGSHFDGAAEVYYNGASWVFAGGTDQVIFDGVSTVSNTTVRVTNTYNKGSRVSVSAWSRSGAITSPLIPIVKTVENTYTDIQFMDPTTGAIVETVPNVSCSFTIQKNHSGPMNLDGVDVDLTAGNIWFYGVLEL